jgi:hypothetical protein
MWSAGYPNFDFIPNFKAKLFSNTAFKTLDQFIFIKVFANETKIGLTSLKFFPAIGYERSCKELMNSLKNIG